MRIVLPQSGQGVQAFFEGLAIAQRCVQPAPQLAAAHGRGAVVQRRKQRRPIIPAKRFTELQVAACCRIEPDKLCGPLGTQPAHMRKQPLLRVLCVAQQRARCTHPFRQVLHIKSRQRVQAKVVLQRAARVTGLKVPIGATRPHATLTQRGVGELWQLRIGD